VFTLNTTYMLRCVHTTVTLFLQILFKLFLCNCFIHKFDTSQASLQYLMALSHMFDGVFRLKFEFQTDLQVKFEGKV